MLGQLLDRWKANTHVTALTAGDDNYSYADLTEMTNIIANNLYLNGIRKNSHIAVFMNNRPELIWIYFAALKLGSVIIPVNYRYKADELNYVLEDSEATLLISEGSKEEYITTLHKRGQLPCRVFSITNNENNIYKNFSRLLDRKTTPHPEQSIKADDLAMILYTSGSTANPKGVMHTHRSIIAAATNLSHTISLNSTCVNGITLPICHIAGLVGQVISTILVGGKIVLFPKFDARVLLNAISQHHLTHLQMVPVNLVEFVEYASHQENEFRSLRVVMVGGDKVPELLQERFYQLTHCYITEVMGMTESFSYLINLSHDKSKLGSAGSPAKGALVEISDDHQNVVTNNYVNGEIRIKSDANMIGYWKKTPETLQTLYDGYVYTGDLAYHDQDGFFWFVGRIKQLIIRGGSNIAPQEVESVLAGHPNVYEVCVMGVPDEKWNHSICACIVLRDPKSPISLKGIQFFCKDKLADYKIPEKLVILSELPHNATGKIDRNKVVALASHHVKPC